MCPSLNSLRSGRAGGQNTEDTRTVEDSGGWVPGLRPGPCQCGEGGQRTRGCDTPWSVIRCQVRHRRGGGHLTSREQRSRGHVQLSKVCRENVYQKSIHSILFVNKMSQLLNYVSSPEKSQLSLNGLVTGPSVSSASVMEAGAGGTPCTPGDPLTQLHHKHKVSHPGAIKIKDHSDILCLSLQRAIRFMDSLQ